MELSWTIKLRIAAAALLGVLLIGVLAWPMVKPADPFMPVGPPAGLDTAVLAALAFFCGFLAYFSAWPYGEKIGIFAVPSGLAVWAIRCGSLGQLLQANPALAARKEIFASLKFESLFWLAIVAAGFLGVIIAQIVTRQIIRGEPEETEKGKCSKSNYLLTSAIAFLASLLIARFLLEIFAAGINISDAQLGRVVAQPSTAQIVFGVMVSFGIAAFVVKLFLQAGYLWPILATGFVITFSVTTSLSDEMLTHMIRQWPAVFFPSSACSVLPLQMVTFGTLGSVIGFWAAVRYNYWRKHEI